MNEEQRELVERLRRKEMELIRNQPRAASLQQQTIHYTELPEGSADSPIAREWNVYRREVGRLLAEGHEGKWVLIKGEEIIGIWDSRDEARAVALERYLMQPVLIHQVLTREPVLRGPIWLRPCPS
jgi:hypothetical protein